MTARRGRSDANGRCNRRLRHRSGAVCCAAERADRHVELRLTRVQAVVPIMSFRLATRWLSCRRMPLCMPPIVPVLALMLLPVSLVMVPRDGTVVADAVRPRVTAHTAPPVLS
jgi:hypothetical protein